MGFDDWRNERGGENYDAEESRDAQHRMTEAQRDSAESAVRRSVGLTGETYADMAAELRGRRIQS